MAGPALGAGVVAAAEAALDAAVAAGRPVFAGHPLRHLGHAARAQHLVDRHRRHPAFWGRARPVDRGRHPSLWG
ncbi:MAG TPA: hypothetical protein P5114_06710, partial [Hyphomicrobiaceae bacterium]|nr:hypothetical protein [Hyphomicrobiaceae bacterium]